MKVSLNYEFDMPEEEGTLQTILKSFSMQSLLYDLAVEIRSHTKHGDPDETITWGELSDWFWRELGDRGIDPYG